MHKSVKIKIKDKTRTKQKAYNSNIKAVRFLVLCLSVCYFESYKREKGRDCGDTNKRMERIKNIEKTAIRKKTISIFYIAGEI